MIRLRRAPEPEDLRRQRAFRVAEALLWPSTEGGPNTDDGYGDPSVRRALSHDTQHGLCAYCGAPIDLSGSAIDHFRPRAIYWWLSWTWDNLWITCNICQEKGSEFELEEHARRLAPPTIDRLDEAFETWREAGLLLDPAVVDDPKLHLRVEPDAHGKWWWVPVPTSRRGMYTWTTLRLGRFETSSDDAFKRSCTYERLNEHLQRRVQPRCEEVRRAIEASDRIHAHALWTCLCDGFLYRKAEHLVPTWWYLDQFHGDHALSEHGMSMPAYPDDRPEAEARPASAARILPEALPCWLLDKRAQLLVCYTSNNKNASSDRLREAIVALVRQQPQTDAELGELIGRERNTIKGHTRALCESGHLERIEGQGSVHYCPSKATRTRTAES